MSPSTKLAKVFILLIFSLPQICNGSIDQLDNTRSLAKSTAHSQILSILSNRDIAVDGDDEANVKTSAPKENSDPIDGDVDFIKDQNSFNEWVDRDRPKPDPDLGIRDSSESSESADDNEDEIDRKIKLGQKMEVTDSALISEMRSSEKAAAEAQVAAAAAVSADEARYAAGEAIPSDGIMRSGGGRQMVPNEEEVQAGGGGGGRGRATIPLEDCLPGCMSNCLPKCMADLHDTKACAVECNEFYGLLAGQESDPEDTVEEQGPGGSPGFRPGPPAVAGGAGGLGGAGGGGGDGGGVAGGGGKESDGIKADVFEYESVDNAVLPHQSPKMDSRLMGPKECEPHCNFECNRECSMNYEDPSKCEGECKSECRKYCQPLYGPAGQTAGDKMLAAREGKKRSSARVAEDDGDGQTGKWGENMEDHVTIAPHYIGGNPALEWLTGRGGGAGALVSLLIGIVGLYLLRQRCWRGAAGDGYQRFSSIA